MRIAPNCGSMMHSKANTLAEQIPRRAERALNFSSNPRCSARGPTWVSASAPVD